ncbi:MAG: proline iminopeptidase-family hydrolase, partial [Phycisphaerae bacterium]|nr:proline iminopeptidase-family hydrolase [Phycisphaerae bacterium]
MRVIRFCLTILIASIMTTIVFAQQKNEVSVTPKIKEGYVNVDGGQVWYQIVGTGNAIPLLVLHGGPGYPHDYLEPIADLGNERPVIFYDQLGCGKSERPLDSALYTIERFVKELAEIREALHLDRVHILGHSWGSMLATDYLLTKPEGVISVILASPCLNSQQWVKDQKKYLTAFPDSIQQLIKISEQQGTTDSDEYQAAIELFYSRHVCRKDPWPEYMVRAMAGVGADVYTYMWGPSEFYCTGNLKDYDRTDRLGEITVPVLFTCGQYDGARPETVKRFH